MNLTTSEDLVIQYTYNTTDNLNLNEGFNTWILVTYKSLTGMRNSSFTRLDHVEGNIGTFKLKKLCSQLLVHTITVTRLGKFPESNVQC